MPNVLRPDRPAESGSGEGIPRPDLSHGHSLIVRIAHALLRGEHSYHRVARVCMPVTVISSMLAVPAFGLLGWGGMLLPATTLLHQAAWVLLMGALFALILGITGSQMCRVVALPVAPLVVLPAVVIVPVLTALPTLVVKPMRPLLQRMPSAKRTVVFRFRYTSDESDAYNPPADTAGT